MRLEGKTALVTGGASGFGAGIARKFVAEGARVMIADIDAPAAEAMAGVLGTAWVAADVGLDAGVAHMAAQTLGTFGPLDILVNNAGITRDQLFMRMSDADWDTVLAVNLTSVMRLSRGVLRGMMKARWGRIVNVSSVVGVTGNPGQANYAASKAAVIGMSKSLAAEVASRGITVNCVAPGFIATAMTGALNDEQKARIAAQIPAGRMGTPDEIAAAALFLASSEAGYVTGQTLHVNGGMAMI